MKTAGFSLLYFIAAGTILADEPAVPATMSSRLSSEIRAGLPNYSPPTAKDASVATPAADPNTLVLPKLTVREKRLPKGDPDLWRSERDIQQRAMKEYKNSMTPLEWAMNSWFIPFVTPPASVRARAAYEDKKLAEQLSMIDRLSKIDKLTGASTDGIKKAVSDMQRADDWQSRPAGSK